MNVAEISREQLGEMPIHVVSQNFGTEGLVARYGIEIAEFTVADQQFLNQALIAGYELHRGQNRSTGPYIDHPLRCAIRIMHHFEIKDPDIIAGSVLHDVPEDQAPKLIDAMQITDPDAQKAAAIEVLTDWFNPRVGQFVSLVTNPEFDKNRDFFEQYYEHLAIVLKAPDPGAGIMKLSDFIDNGVGIIWGTGPKMLPWARKYLGAAPQFEEFIERPDLPFSDEVRAHLRAQIKLGRERFNEIIANN